MLYKALLGSVLLTSSLFGEFQYSIDNTNFTISQNSSEYEDFVYNYNRLRFQGDYTNDILFFTFIGDGVNYYADSFINGDDFEYVKLFKSDTPFKTQTEFKEYSNGVGYAKLYRAYGGYEDEYNRIIMGLQNISMGVGRIWTPTNLFNPKNMAALEPDEVFGVAAISYTRHLGDTSRITLVSSQKSDDSFKYALSYKAFLDFTDFGLNIVSSDDTKMYGYELEANLADTGIEVRSEGAYIKSTIYLAEVEEEKEFFQAVLGADYGFEDGITLVGELLYTSEKFTDDEIYENFDSEILSNLMDSNLYGAISVSYGFNLFLSGSLLYMDSLEDDSSLVTANLSYGYDDYNTFSLGSMLQDDYQTYYFSYGLSF